MKKYFFWLAVLPCVWSEICMRLLGNKQEISILRRMSGHIWRWNAIRGEFEQLEALKLNNSAFCSVDTVNDLHGKMMTVIVYSMKPYTVTNANNTRVTGFIGDIWKILEETLKFKTIYRRPGQKIADTLMNGDTHALLVATAMYSYPMSYYTYSTPFTTNSYYLFVQPEDIGVSKWWYTNIFSPGLWLISFTFIVCITCITIGVYHIRKLIYINYEECDNELSSLSFVLLHVLGGICGQGIQKIPRTWCLRLIALSSLIMGMLLSYGLNSTLTSYLTIKGNFLPIANLKDVTQKRTHSVCVRKNSSAYLNFLSGSHEDDDLKPEWKGLVNQACPDMTDSQTLASKLCRPGFVYLEAPDIFLPIYHQVQQQCRIVQAPGAYLTVRLTFLHLRTSPYRRIIDVHLMRLRSAGILRYLKKKWILKEIDRQYNQLQWSAFQPVEYTHIHFTSLGFFAMTLISVLICILENIWYKMRSKYMKTNSNLILRGICNNSPYAMKAYHKARSNIIRHRRIHSILLSGNMKKKKFLQNVTVQVQRW